MKKKMNENEDSPFLTRRDFARQSACAALGITGVVNMLTHLRLINGAVAADARPGQQLEPGVVSPDPGGGDYKALVCLFLQGGNDANNVVIPISEPDYANYVADRGIIAIQPKSSILPITPATYSDGIDYGLHPNLTGVHQLFNQNKLAILANVGTLAAPITKQEYLNGSVGVPTQLFSHSDQSVQWQSSIADQPFTTGWGGRVADLLVGLNGTAEVSMSISLAGSNSFQVGNTTSQYHVTPDGSISFSGYGTNYSNALEPDMMTYKDTNAGKRLKAFHDIMALEPANLFQRAYADKVNRAYENDLLLTAALEGVVVNTPFPDSSIGDQMNMIAKLIAARSALGQQRQIFFCEIKGYDTHANQLSAHANLMTEMSEAIKAFYDATVELGVADKVTGFTASDFGRTYTPNGVTSAAGADHGWGSHGLIFGDAVQGGDMYGEMPELVVDGPDDVNGDRGRWIPKTSVDEYSATLAKWFGVGSEEMNNIFPNLPRFNTPDLGFML